MLKKIFFIFLGVLAIGSLICLYVTNKNLKKFGGFNSALPIAQPYRVVVGSTGSSTIEFITKGGTAVTTTNSGTTSTLTFTKNTCENVVSPTGSRWSVVWIGGQPVSSQTPCN